VSKTYLTTSHVTTRHGHTVTNTRATSSQNRNRNKEIIFSYSITNENLYVPTNVVETGCIKQYRL